MHATLSARRLWLAQGLLVTAALSATSTPAADLTFKERVLPLLVERVPGILATFDPETGHFGSGIWISTDQNSMYPLAVAYATQSDENPYYKDKQLLDVIMKAGDALIADADAQGMWTFRKKDGSTWGQIWMPWTYSRWVRSYSLIRDDMPPERQQAWADALTLGYEGISNNHLQRVHNIPVHHAMGLYVAGQALDRPEWCAQAAAFLRRAAGEQSEGGYWTENSGPVVNYNFVYIDALGVYYALSRDEAVLPALSKGAAFHYHFRYPNGKQVDTIDERNPYKPSKVTRTVKGADGETKTVRQEAIDLGNVGFTFTPLGRAYLKEQWTLGEGQPLTTDFIASLLLYGDEGAVEEGTANKRVADDGASRGDDTFVLVEGGENRAATIRSGPWFVALSAYTAPIPKSRWIQDRQNLVGVYHDRVGLILGGGNTKLQPAWSNFTVGDMALLSHQPGDTAPDFLPAGELYHVPSAANLVLEPDAGLDLAYGPAECTIRVRRQSDTRLEYEVSSTATTEPVYAHLTLIPHMGEALMAGGAEEVTLGKEPVEWSPQEVGGQITHAGWRLHLPATASVHWPALPHNPYRKDGHAEASEGRIEVRIPLDPSHPSETIGLEIVP